MQRMDYSKAEPHCYTDTCGQHTADTRRGSEWTDTRHISKHTKGVGRRGKDSSSYRPLTLAVTTERCRDTGGPSQRRLQQKFQRQ